MDLENETKRDRFVELKAEFTEAELLNIEGTKRRDEDNDNFIVYNNKELGVLAEWVKTTSEEGHVKYIMCYGEFTERNTKH